NHLYPVLSEKEFRKDLDFLLTHFSPAGFDEVLAFAGNRKKINKPRFFLSFDDGFSECYNVVAPILKEKGVPAAFFVNPAFVGNKQLSHRQKVSLVMEEILNCTNKNLLLNAANIFSGEISGKDDLIRSVKKLSIADFELIDAVAAVFQINFQEALSTFQPYMNMTEIQQLKSGGFVIGSHSFDHPEFNLLSLNKMKEQLENSFRYLETHLKIEHRVFSFPFNDIGVPASFFNYLTNDCRVEASFGTSGMKLDEAPQNLHRIPMELYGLEGAEVIIRSEYFYYLGKALVGKNRVNRQ
ncbi:MAG TPA: polysaccharide deacetylase family protein, partial [Draconibacterium sp.]|nr:polysaccharide deacetylase family protein [Draconibacterium sp.]